MLRIFRLIIEVGAGILLPISLLVGVETIPAFITFLVAIIFIFYELFKLVVEAKTPNNSKGISKFIFKGETKQGLIFRKESLVTSKGSGKFWIWFSFICSILYVVIYIVYDIISK
jgi:hypothetical protein